MQYKGSCHCGAVTFEAEGEIKNGLACNCSICQRRGSLLWFVPRTSFKLLSGADSLTTYTFNKHAIQHRFCKVCGILPFAEAAMPDGTPMSAINIRCLEGIDLDAIPVTHYDGRAI
ncbi:MAG: GFA family protein [Rhodocyclaceae bacterium]